MPWVAARQSAQGHEATMQYPKAVDSFDGILRATRVKAAMVADERTDQKLVAADQYMGEPTHVSSRIFVQCCCSERYRSWLSTRSTAGRHITTMSTRQCGQCWRLKLSRISRLMRFLSTALAAHFRDTASPRRGDRGPGAWAAEWFSSSVSSGTRARSVKNRSDDLIGSAKTRRNCASR